ncbi:MAG: RecQ family ATP-dependent DNA helicase [Paludibacteraceae bacterium]|nr:RecQ family ATP-dependent DNA helicase [Paludibacteraceae bacterium]MED9995945.1 ATP-dependent DNA helicase RecQ [Paludibacteraceae bacterium]
MSQYRAILQQYWGYSDFRPLQHEIIASVGSGQDTLGLMPTGGGKSITFQVPALALDGLCLVITPLIALMKDQVANLQAKQIKAAAIYAGMDAADIQRTFDNCIYGHYKFLYISPERLSTRTFLEKLPMLRISMLAIDEAHCISQWGYDFRPAYREIANLRKLIPHVPVLAVTATATPKVAADIQLQLGFTRPNVWQKSFFRPNLSYSVRQTEDKLEQLIRILNGVPGSSVVYVRNRKKTAEIAEFLQEKGIKAQSFHAGLPAATKDERQNAWKKGDCRVIVATNAFGMGIDKADVRSVVHIDMPESIEAYFQEAGRAGRDEKKAYCVLLYNNSDLTQAKKRIKESFPEKSFIANTYNQLAYFFQLGIGSGLGSLFQFNLGLFCKTYHLPIQSTHHALKILELAGYIEYHDEIELKSRVQFTCPRNQLYNLRVHPFAEQAMQALLRSYTGIFAELTPIEEDTLANHAGLTRQEITAGLIELSHEHIITYVPHQKSPCIIYTRERVDGNRLRITEDVYERRKDRYQERIEAMVRYATSTDYCRSQLLLSYFGEKQSVPCGQCDYCLKKHKQPTNIRQEIKKLLAEQPHSINQLLERLPQNKTEIVDAIRDMLDTGDIIQKNYQLQLA